MEQLWNTMALLIIVNKYEEIYHCTLCRFKPRDFFFRIHRSSTAGAKDIKVHHDGAVSHVQTTLGWGTRNWNHWNNKIVTLSSTRKIEK